MQEWKTTRKLQQMTCLTRGHFQVRLLELSSSHSVCSVLCTGVLWSISLFLHSAISSCQPINDRLLEASQTDDKRDHVGFVGTCDEKMARTIMDPFRPRWWLAAPRLLQQTVPWSICVNGLLESDKFDPLSRHYSVNEAVLGGSCSKIIKRKISIFDCISNNTVRVVTE